MYLIRLQLKWFLFSFLISDIYSKRKNSESIYQICSTSGSEFMKGNDVIGATRTNGVWKVQQSCAELMLDTRYIMINK